MTIPGPGDEPRADSNEVRRRASGGALWLVLGVLGVATLLLTVRGWLPAAPIFVVLIVLMGAGLWWFADRGGRHRDRPLAGPIEALLLLAAPLAAIVAFWLLWDLLA